MQNEAPRPSGFRATKAAILFVMAIVAWLYHPALGFPFVYDDVDQIALNPHIYSWRFLPVYFTEGVWNHVSSNASHFYRPLFLIWLRVNHGWFGDEPWGWHLTTILVHLLAAFLVYLLARTLLKEPLPAVFAAAIFAVHPIQVEAVAWVSGVTEPLAGVAFMAAFLCYLQGRKASRHKAAWRAGSLSLYAAAILVKETGAVLPLVIAAYEWWEKGTLRSPHPVRPFFGRQIRSLAPYGAILLVYLTARTWATHGLPPRNPVPLGVSLLSWPWLLSIYVRLLFWPTKLSPLYDFSYVSRTAGLRVLVPSLVLVVCVVLLLRWRRRHPTLLPMFLASWFGITLLPALVQFLLARPSENYHDRYLYLPSVAWALTGGAILAQLESRTSAWRRSLAWSAATLLSIVLLVSTRAQMMFWQSNYSLFARAHQLAPQNELAASNFAAELIKRGNYREARDLSEHMIALHPGTAAPCAAAGSASFLLRDYAAAERYYLAALQSDPQQYQYLYMLALARIRLHKYPEAILALRQATRLSPQEPMMHYALGMAFAQLDDWGEARDEFLAELGLHAEASQGLARDGLAQAEDHLRAKVLPATLSR
jgi:protein O-mannosyl-transferase